MDTLAHTRKVAGAMVEVQLEHGFLCRHPDTCCQKSAPTSLTYDTIQNPEEARSFPDCNMDSLHRTCKLAEALAVF
jgi:hypothetical protein